MRIEGRGGVALILMTAIDFEPEKKFQLTKIKKYSLH